MWAESHVVEGAEGVAVHPHRGVESIQAARARLEAENEAFLEEQARLRAEARARAVEPAALLATRTRDLAYLERERLKAEAAAIEAVDYRIELELRALELAHAKEREELLLAETLQEKVRFEEEARTVLQARIEEETRVLVRQRQCRDAGLKALEAETGRRVVQEALLEQLAERERLALDERQQAQEQTEQIVVERELHDRGQRLDRSRRQVRWLLSLLVLTWGAALLAGVFHGLGDGWSLGAGVISSL